MTNAEKRHQKAAAKRIERAGHHKAGFCIGCYRRAVKGKVRCRLHLDQQAAAMRTKRAARKKAARAEQAAIRIAEIRAVQEERIRLGLPLSLEARPVVPEGARTPVEL